MKFFLKKTFLKMFVPLFLLLLSFSIGVGYFIYHEQRTRIIDGFTEFYTDLLFQRSELIRATLSPTIANLRFIASRYQLLDSNGAQQQNSVLLQDLKLLGTYNRTYGQLRVIDRQGRERIRVNRNGNTLVVVNDSLLQNKSIRPYFRKTMSMKPRQIYVSPLDLNIEFGKIEYPLQRVIRFGIPIYGEGQKPDGGIFINQYLNSFFQLLPIHKNRKEGHLMFLNKEGYWLYGPSRFPVFGFMYPGKQNENFQHYFPAVWAKMQMGEYGHLMTKDTLFVFRNMVPDYVDKDDLFLVDRTSCWDPDDNWKLVAEVNLNNVASLVNLRYYFLLVMLVVVFILFCASYLVSRLRFVGLSHQKELEQFNLLLEEKIRQRTEQLAIQNKKLSGLNIELESFAYSVSHDLRAPLRHISGFVELLKKHNQNTNELGGKSMRYLTYIRRAAEEMGLLIDDLLRLSRVGRTELTFQHFCMSDLVRPIIREIEEEYPGHRFDWKVGIMPEVIADHALMRQVWRNLLGNAAKYSSQEPCSVITLSYIDRLDYDEFTVEDNGVGFDMQYGHKIFGTFQRLHSSDEFEGHGIGLAIVQRIILKHGGMIRAEGKVGEGAVFYFSILKQPVK